MKRIRWQVFTGFLATWTGALLFSANEDAPFGFMFGAIILLILSVSVFSMLAFVPEDEI